MNSKKSFVKTNNVYGIYEEGVNASKDAVNENRENNRINEIVEFSEQIQIKYRERIKKKTSRLGLDLQKSINTIINSKNFFMKTNNVYGIYEKGVKVVSFKLMRIEVYGENKRDEIN